MRAVEMCAIADRMIAALYDAAADGRALTTSEVCAAAGPYLRTAEGCDDFHHSDDFKYQLVECDGRRHLIAVPLMHFQRGYKVLRRLKATGVVLQTRIAGERAAYWSLMARMPRIAIDDMEAAYLAPAATPRGGRPR
jgi:hypothetical protein